MSSVKEDAWKIPSVQLATSSLSKGSQIPGQGRIASNLQVQSPLCFAKTDASKSFRAKGPSINLADRLIN